MHAQAAAGLKIEILIWPKATPMRPAFSSRKIEQSERLVANSA